MKTPQIIYVVLTLASMCYTAYLHGKPKEGKHNFFVSLLATFLTWIILITGGFFK